MIVTVTLNPAWDVTYRVASLVPGEVHRVGEVHRRPGGKGVNVASVLSRLGHEVVATGFADEAFERAVAGLGVGTRFVTDLPGVRSTVAVVSDASTTSLWEPGVALADPDASVRRLREALDALLPGAGVLVVSGSLPPGVPASLPAELAAHACERGLAAIVDTSGEALGVAARTPGLVLRPNADELAELVGRPVGAWPSRDRGQDLVVSGLAGVLAPRGAEGIGACVGPGAWHGPAPRAMSGNPTGAGDAAAAAVARALDLRARPAGGGGRCRRARRHRRRRACRGRGGPQALRRAARPVTPVPLSSSPGVADALARMSDLAATARAAGRGIGAFNVIALEHAEAIVAGAEVAGLPVVMQISENTADYHRSLTPIARACLAVAAESTAQVVVHLDHATREELVREAIDLGVGSVMFDASALPHEENVERTRAVTEHAHSSDVWVEAELGEVGGKDGVHAPGVRTRPDEAADYVAATGVDALAVAVGSSHAMLTRDAVLDDVLIAEIAAAVPVPLVLHGSSGVPDDGLVSAVRHGMTKINIATHLNQVMAAAVRDALADPAVVDTRKYLGPGRDAVAAEVARLLTLLAGEVSGRALGE